MTLLSLGRHRHRRGVRITASALAVLTAGGTLAFGGTGRAAAAPTCQMVLTVAGCANADAGVLEALVGYAAPDGLVGGVVLVITNEPFRVFVVVGTGLPSGKQVVLVLHGDQESSQGTRTTGFDLIALAGSAVTPSSELDARATETKGPTGCRDTAALFGHDPLGLLQGLPAPTLDCLEPVPDVPALPAVPTVLPPAPALPRPPTLPPLPPLPPLPAVP